MSNKNTINKEECISNNWLISFGAAHIYPGELRPEKDEDKILSVLPDTLRKGIPAGKKTLYIDTLRKLVKQTIMYTTRESIVEELDKLGVNFLGRENTYLVIKELRKEYRIDRSTKKKSSEETIRIMARQGHTLGEIVEATGLSRPHVYKKACDMGVRGHIKRKKYERKIVVG